MKKFLQSILPILLFVPASVLADGFYAGAHVGFGSMGGKRTVHGLPTPSGAGGPMYYLTKEKASATGFLINGIGGYQWHTKGDYVYGAEFTLGYTRYKKTLKGTEPGNPKETIKATLERPLGMGLVGFFGKEFQDFTLALKLGLAFSLMNFKWDDYKSGSKTNSQKTSRFAPGLLLGLSGVLPLGKDRELTIDYAYAHALKKDVKVRQQSNETDAYYCLQTAHAPNIHSFAVGVLWHF